MIVLTVIGFNGAAVSIAPVSFDEIGGTIGRADTNQLVLPDPERTISRVHAHVVFRAGNYALIDRGGNAVLHNGQAVTSGTEARLSHGDEIQIGGYRIAVSTGAVPVVNDPFADFDTVSAGFPASSTPKVAAGMKVAAAQPVGGRSGGYPASPAPAKPALGSGMGIPDDWDPFQTDDPGNDQFGGLPGKSAAPAARPTALNPSNAFVDNALQLSTAGDKSLDSLFGLSGMGGGADPLAGSSLLAPKNLPNTAGGGDPLQALQEIAVSAPAVVSDHVSDLNMPWHEMAIKPRAPPAKEAGLQGAVFSWDQTNPKVASVPQAFAGATPLSAAAAAPPPRPAASDLRAASPVQSGARAAPPERQFVASSGDANILLNAFLEGLGVPDLRLRPVTPEAMLQLGKLLRESTQGTVELLAARTTLKKEIRAEVTVMGAVANNALKFSPTVEFALQYLMGPPTPGFMGPVDSMRDAFDDLKAHQLGVMAGMRAALSDVLKKFDPAVLESKLAPRSALASLIPSGRKARLWELFQDLFGQLVNEAEEDFDELFGKAFVREYERYVAQLTSPK